MRTKVWLSILLCISMLAGCSFPANNSLELLENGDKDGQGLTSDSSHGVKLQADDILVNQLGYQPEDNKIAILQGSDLNSAFYIYDAVTDEAVMAGILKEAGLTAYQTDGKKSKEEDALYLADFSGLEEEGYYYLFQKDLGYSDAFWIKADIYTSLEAYILEELAAENRDTSSLCYQLAGMLLALELYPDQIQEPEELQRILAEKTALLSQAQNQETGGVYEAIAEAPEPSSEKANSGEPKGDEGTLAISLAATAEFAGVMAMYAGYLRSIDRVLADQYGRMAEKAYTSIQNSLDNVSYDAGYFAVAQLFKQTGKNKYAQTLGQYLSMREEQKSYTEYDFSLFGDYAYLSCNYSVNLEWSRQLMNKVMKQAENISLTSSREHYYISRQREHYEVDGILRDAAVMALVNYIITNHEYSTLQKNYLDYLLGRNPESCCLVEGFGTRNRPRQQEEMVDKENAALFYLLLQSTK